MQHARLLRHLMGGLPEARCRPMTPSESDQRRGDRPKHPLPEVFAHLLPFEAGSTMLAPRSVSVLRATPAFNGHCIVLRARGYMRPYPVAWSANLIGARCSLALRFAMRFAVCPPAGRSDYRCMPGRTPLCDQPETTWSSCCPCFTPERSSHRRVDVGSQRRRHALAAVQSCMRAFDRKL